jgi:hypothetical protein
MRHSIGSLAFATCLCLAGSAGAQSESDIPTGEEPPLGGDNEAAPPTARERKPARAQPQQGARRAAARQAPAKGQPTESTSVEEVEGDDPNVADTLGIEPTIFTARLYGFIDAHFEQVARTPVGVDEEGETVTASNPSEIDVTNFNVMLQGSVYQRYRYFVNLASPGAGSPAEDAGLAVRNAWVELPLFREYFNFRIGKTYRRFGLYNELLDAIPTFIGIEPPEMFDDDHLLLTRTTNIMLHGTFTTSDSSFSYALSTGTDEREGHQVPIGADLRYDFRNNLRIGTSYYTTNGDAVPSKELGEGAPLGGVATWMDEDEFSVTGGYGQVTAAGFILQGEFWFARHNATRNAALVVELMNSDPPLNERQLEQFGLSDPENPEPRLEADYNVKTGYVRTGYSIPVSSWSLTPYGQFDYYANPEIINDQDNGGDNEAGLTDNGTFYKSTLGIVIRPVSFIAVKIDGSTHTQKFNRETVTYPEIRSSFSFYWELGGVR